MKLTPLADHVLLKAYEPVETTQSGFILSSASKEKSSLSEVVAVGPGTEEVTMAVKPGDYVVVAKFAGTEVKVDGTEYTIVKQDDILAIVE